ncbi:MAG: hypothetical protein BWX47_02005 [candidate division Hyd24-12 bacterium ADurb.Bin004]|nr:MAG: hypothetical protein BWX47_02005 [candidate division Hyd24-12 bacterium ADurb.Bin004]
MIQRGPVSGEEVPGIEPESSPDRFIPVVPPEGPSEKHQRLQDETRVEAVHPLPVVRFTVGPGAVGGLARDDEVRRPGGLCIEPSADTRRVAPGEDLRGKEGGVVDPRGIPGGIAEADAVRALEPAQGFPDEPHGGFEKFARPGRAAVAEGIDDEARADDGRETSGLEERPPLPGEVVAPAGLCIRRQCRFSAGAGSEQGCAVRAGSAPDEGILQDSGLHAGRVDRGEVRQPREEQGKPLWIDARRYQQEASGVERAAFHRLDQSEPQNSRPRQGGTEKPAVQAVVRIGSGEAEGPLARPSAPGDRLQPVEPPGRLTHPRSRGRRPRLSPWSRRR